MQLKFSAQYYERLSRGCRRSAAAVVPLVFDMLRPTSVVDVGCGTGAWLAEFKRRGVTDVLGVDGPHMPARQLEIDPHEFVAVDFTAPLQLERQFDLAISLEVAEHVAAARVDQLLDTLTQAAPAVLFSAAVPYQGGEHHVNEQWPAYWAERFSTRGFVALDPFRRLLWDRADVDWWYAQNLLLFVRRDEFARFPRLAEMAGTDPANIPIYIHPRNYLHHAWRNHVLRVAVDLATTTRPGDVIILADEDRFGTLYLPGRAVRPFLERDGMYFGPPRDDAEAIDELQRMKFEGATYLAVGWPAFWWLSHYKGFAKYLETHHYSVLRNDHVLMYRLDVDYTPIPIPDLG